MDDQPAEGGLPVGAIRPLPQGPQSSDGISWRDIQDINVRLGKVEQKVKIIEDGQTGKSERSFQTRAIVISVVLTASASIVAPLAFDRLWPEQPEPAASEAP